MFFSVWMIHINYVLTVISHTCPSELWSPVGQVTRVMWKLFVGNSLCFCVTLCLDAIAGARAVVAGARRAGAANGGIFAGEPVVGEPAPILPPAPAVLPAAAAADDDGNGDDIEPEDIPRRPADVGAAPAAEDLHAPPAAGDVDARDLAAAFVDTVIDAAVSKVDMGTANSAVVGEDPVTAVCASILVTFMKISFPANSLTLTACPLTSFPNSTP